MLLCKWLASTGSSSCTRHQSSGPHAPQISISVRFSQSLNEISTDLEINFERRTETEHKTLSQKMEIFSHYQSGGAGSQSVLHHQTTEHGADVFEILIVLLCVRDICRFQRACMPNGTPLLPNRFTTFMASGSQLTMPRNRHICKAGTNPSSVSIASDTMFGHKTGCLVDDACS
jgi:hypothetical protein